MFTTSESQQIFSVVSSAYVSERHTEDFQSDWLAAGGDESFFNEVLKSLRSALSLGRQQ